MWKQKLVYRFLRVVKTSWERPAATLPPCRYSRYYSTTVGEDYSRPPQRSQMAKPENVKVTSPGKVQLCKGCGVRLHSNEPNRLGYITSLDKVMCQRCFHLTHYGDALHVTLSTEEYLKVLSEMGTKKALVLLMVDLVDFPSSLFPNISQLMSRGSEVIIVGNKADLLLKSDNSKLLNKYCKYVLEVAEKSSLSGCRVRGVHFISAKTGQGIDDLVKYIMTGWGNRGGVYLLGCTNVGKSTLFNQLLKMICGSDKLDHNSPATISRLPGTTLDVLKFPLVSVMKWRRLLERKERIAKLGYEPELRGGYVPPAHRHWLHDTPGAVNDKQLINLLTTAELKKVLPSKPLSPRTFVLKPGQTLFLGGLYRLDYISGDTPAYFTVFASHLLPLHTTKTAQATALYERHVGGQLLGVPIGGADRMADFPPLQPITHNITGIGWKESTSDLIFSGVGWVAVTSRRDTQVHLEVLAPSGIDVPIRIPSLLPTAVNQRGSRSRNDKTKFH